MYKVRDDVLLEKLEDFGFHYDNKTNCWYDLENCHLVAINWYINLIRINAQNRELIFNKDIHDELELKMLIDKIYDLTIWKIIERV